MSCLDRALQKNILNLLLEYYPYHCNDLLVRLQPGSASTDDAIVANINYLTEYGLMKPGFTFNINNQRNSAPQIITAKGLDFLTDDGGLGAILGVVTVKLHAETIRDLLASKIDETNLNQEQKSTLKQKLSTLSGEALKEMTNELVRKGIEQTPNLISWIETLLTRA